MRDAGMQPRRFFADADVEESEGGFRIALDGRPARTPGRAALTLPTRELGEAVAAEWREQAEVIEQASMPLTRLSNTAIDGVAPARESVRGEIARYASSDLVIYRAADPEALVAAQSAAWDPVLDWAWRDLGARFALSQGIRFVEQPPVALARVGERLAAETSPFRLGALHVVTTLSGSVLIGLMLAARALSPEDAWLGAHVDELFQENRWGADAEAGARRERRRRDFEAASRMLDLA